MILIIFSSEKSLKFSRNENFNWSYSDISFSYPHRLYLLIFVTLTVGADDVISVVVGDEPDGNTASHSSAMVAAPVLTALKQYSLLSWAPSLQSDLNSELGED